MNDCVNGDMRDRLPDLVNGSLSRDEREAVESHVSACAECAAEVELLRTARAALRVAPAMDVNRIVSAVQSAGAQRIAARRAWLSPGKLAAMAAAVAIIVVVLVSRDDAGRAVPSGSAVAVASETRPANDSAIGSGAVAVAAAAPASRSETRSDPSPLVPEPGRSLLALGTDVSDLGEDQLVALLESVSELDAIPSEEPMSPEIEAINVERQR